MAAVDTKINNVKTRLSNRSALKNLVPGTIAGDLIETISIELNNTDIAANIYADKTNIAIASAQDLDKIGEFFGNKRLSSVTPTITDTMRVLKFYVESGTFGNINNAQNITVPAGTSVEGVSEFSLFKFVTEKELILPAGASELYFGAKLVSGLNDIIPANTLNAHNFVTYTDNANSSLKVTNSFVVGSGRLLEKDDNYRARIKYTMRAYPKTNTTAITDYINSIPGVAKVVINTAPTTGGTLNIYVQSISPYTSDEVIQNIEAALSEFVNPWCSFNILRPNYIGLKVNLALKISNLAQYQGNTSFQKLITESLSKYINNFAGEYFDLNYLITAAQSFGYGITGGTITSASMFIGEDIAREERVMDIVNGQTSIFISSTERLLVEPTLNAITVSFS
jgi:hypothetical protein